MKNTGRISARRIKFLRLLLLLKSHYARFHQRRSSYCIAHNWRVAFWPNCKVA
jgi:hypothetical protein